MICWDRRLVIQVAEGYRKNTFKGTLKTVLEIKHCLKFEYCTE